MKMIQGNTEALFYVDEQEVGKIQYQGNPLCIEHVIVYDAFQGKGYASMMMKLLSDALKDTPFTCTCSYAIAWMKKHKDNVES